MATIQTTAREASSAHRASRTPAGGLGAARTRGAGVVTATWAVRVASPPDDGAPVERTTSPPGPATTLGQMTTSRPWAGRRLHFVGIGGAGMNGWARVSAQLGAQVSGSDRAESPVLERLRAA